jgi:hypothetical protein
VDKADGVLFVADMSAVRRGQRDDYMEIKRAYRTVMERLVARNGRNRVVPIALVLTKCDEYVDQNTGGLNHRAIEQGLWAYGFNDIAPEWAQMNDEAGPGFVEFTQWTTSAITFSRPKEGPDGNWDFTQPFDIAPPPPPIMPSNCAAPLLWLSAKVLRWNVTMFSDLRSFLLGHSPKSRRHIDAALELERVANMRAAQ